MLMKNSEEPFSDIVTSRPIVSRRTNKEKEESQASQVPCRVRSANFTALDVKKKGNGV
jgi:hypothetical protein